METENNTERHGFAFLHCAECALGGSVILNAQKETLEIKA